MTRAQRIALDHPCFLAGETMHDRFVSGAGRYSVIVTVNAGYE